MRKIFHRNFSSLEARFLVVLQFGQLLHFDSSRSETKSKIQNIAWGKVIDLSNNRLPSKEKSDIETYQNTQICYEK